MRSSKSRSRNKSNRQRSLGNVVNRVFDSSGPEGKVRGTPQQIIEKYLTLARDAQLSNDRVAEQSFLQHAEHYTRMLGEAQREMAERQQQHQQNHRQNGSGNGDDESGPNRDGGQSNGRDHATREPGDRGGRDMSRRPDAPAAEQGPEKTETAPPSDERAPQPQAGGEAAAGLPDAVAHDGDGEQAGPVETPETEAKPARTRSPRPRTPRSATGRTRRKPAEAAADGEPAVASEPHAAGDNGEG